MQFFTGAGMIIPTIITDRVFHIGSMNATHRGRQGSSLEGHCLSVSHAPNAWRKIARLGGNPLQILTKESAVFFDMLSLYQPEYAELSLRIKQWGLESSLVQEITMWRAWSQDGDTEEWQYMLLGSQDAAFLEVDYDGVYESPHDVPGPAGTPGVEPVRVLVGTDLLADRVLQSGLYKVDASDFLTLVWVEDHLPQVEGVWWREEYDPLSHSAPRGGIFPSRLAGWELSGPIDFTAVDDDESGSLCRPSRVEFHPDPLSSGPT